MRYFGVNRKVKVESKYWEGPKEKLKQNEVVVHKVEVNMIKISKFTDFNFVYKQYADKFDIEVDRTYFTTNIYFKGKRKDLQEEFGKLNEVKT